MREVGQLSGSGGQFKAIIFGYCPQQSKLRVFTLNPNVAAIGAADVVGIDAPSRWVLLCCAAGKQIGTATKAAARVADGRIRRPRWRCCVRSP